MRFVFMELNCGARGAGVELLKNEQKLNAGQDRTRIGLSCKKSYIMQKVTIPTWTAVRPAVGCVCVAPP